MTAPMTPPTTVPATLLARLDWTQPGCAAAMTGNAAPQTSAASKILVFM